MKNPEKFWDRVAKRFDKEDKPNARTIEKIKKHLNTGDTVLDYGCATGVITYEIADRVKEIHGIDISSKMIEHAKGKLTEHKEDNIDFTQATIFDERLETESFDVVLAMNIFLFMEDTKKGLRRINELLKPGGLIVSETACMGERKTSPTAIGVFLLSKLGISPTMKFFRISELEALISGENFQILDTDNSYFHNQPVHFLVARKK
jgi:2-polyprenyl-3-methyl-5-hydroxy-6-metoxy-1,4-benzoquinol methylase